MGLEEWVNWIYGIVGFVLGSGSTFLYQKTINKNNNTKSDQQDSNVGGNQAGRDVNIRK